MVIGNRRHVGHTRTMANVAIVARQTVKVMLLSLFLVGWLSLAWWGVYVLAGVMYVFGGAEDHSLTAETPRWLLYPMPLAILGLLPSVQETLKRMGIHD